MRKVALKGRRNLLKESLDDHHFSFFHRVAAECLLGSRSSARFSAYEKLIGHSHMLDVDS